MALILETIFFFAVLMWYKPMLFMALSFDGIIVEGAKPDQEITGVGFIGMSGSTVQMNSVACGDWWISSGSGDPDK